jgi:hypothetical protein
MAPGYCSTTANAPRSAASAAAPTTISMPSGAARVRITSIVCANTSAATKQRLLALLLIR